MRPERVNKWPELHEIYDDDDDDDDDDYLHKEVAKTWPV